jgi:hypothetical protein
MYKIKKKKKKKKVVKRTRSSELASLELENFKREAEKHNKKK